MTSRTIRRALALLRIAGLLVVFWSVPATAQTPTRGTSDVVISQVYGGGGNAGAVLKNDFVELYNRGSVAVDLTGWSVQYASASGSSWNKTNLGGTIQPGAYYLVQQAPGSGGTMDLPTPDAVGTVALSATSGKVALVADQAPLTCGAAADTCVPTPSPRDLVGYGASARSFEGPGPAAAPSSTLAVFRKDGGRTDSDDNASDFETSAPTPRNGRPRGAAPAATSDASACAAPFTPIYEVQGSGPSSPRVDQVVTTQGVVTGDFQGSDALQGFFLQDPRGDGNASTSDGIFVFVPASSALSSVDVRAGDVVRVSGTVKEFNTLTELDSVTRLLPCGTDAVAATPVDLPEAALGGLERYEGMLLTFPETLTVSQSFFLGRYGQVTLSAEGRLLTPTDRFPAGSPEALAAADENARGRFVLDDGRGTQNPTPIPYLGADSTLRAGDTVTGLTGVLDFGPVSAARSMREYRVQPTQPVQFQRVNARTLVPEEVGGNLKVASFNVLNYFNGDGQGGGFPTPRGADTPEEFARQRAKIIAGLQAIDADVVGLMEMENDGVDALSAVQDLVDGLNEAMGAGVYALVAEPNPGTDAIKVALIYKPERVTPVGTAANYQGADETYGSALFERAPLAQTFLLNANGGTMTVVVNHLKSKGSCPRSGPDADQGDGQGCWSAKRVRQAQDLLTFISSLQIDANDPDVLVIGDLNSYAQEDPPRTLMEGGLADQVARLSRAPYSYVFDSQAGSLDHALATPDLASQVTGVTDWHINADEPSVLDYNTEFKPRDLYAPTPYRSSDHDPVVVGIELQGAPDGGSPEPAGGSETLAAE